MSALVGIGDIYPTVFDETGELTLVQPGPAVLAVAARRLRGLINYALLTGSRLVVPDSWLVRNPALCELWLQDGEDGLGLLARSGLLVAAVREGATLESVYRQLTPTPSHSRHVDVDRHASYVERISSYFDTGGLVWRFDLSEVARHFDADMRHSFSTLLRDHRLAGGERALIEKLWRRARRSAKADPVTQVSSGSAVVNAKGWPCIARRHMEAYDATRNRRHELYAPVQALVKMIGHQAYSSNLIRQSRGSLTALSFRNDVPAVRAAADMWTRVAPDLQVLLPHEHSWLPTLFATPSAAAEALSGFSFRDILAVREGLSLGELHQRVVAFACAERTTRPSPETQEALYEFAAKVCEGIVLRRAGVDAARIQHLRTQQKSRWEILEVPSYMVTLGGVAWEALKVGGVVAPFVTVATTLCSVALWFHRKNKGTGAAELKLLESFLAAESAENAEVIRAIIVSNQSSSS